MAVTIDDRIEDTARKEERQRWARRVVVQWGTALPDRRLLIVLDSKNCEVFGEWNRGRFAPVNRATICCWALCIDNGLHEIDLQGHITYLFDCVIYLQERACVDEPTLTMTLAHELQHYVQYCTATEIWAANTVVNNLHRDTINLLGLDWHSLPTEREARIVAKRVSESLLGGSMG